MRMDRSTTRRGALAGALTAVALISLLATSAGATATSDSPSWMSVPKWYQYGHKTWEYGWQSSPRLVRENNRWENNHPNATWQETHDWHLVLRDRWRSGHFHDAVAYDAGQATWYDQTGTIGACGVPLRGRYAASRTLPCGSVVSVRHDGHYVFVHILDRGPYGSSSRIIDLSTRAFRHLAPLGAGVIDVHLVHVQRGTNYRLR